tara:strand:+ start:3456 stop:4496 length:1041 start_codon:yes stop_codon:yes gene_type:complete
MDDFDISTIVESKNEWCARFVNILTPCMIHGIRSIFNEGYKMCVENDEENKYLMTFQNLLNNIPKWSSEIVKIERERIETSSNCNYLDDLLSCVHILQLKSLTSSRVGLKQKKLDIDIPNLDSFIHGAYINIARQVYLNVYLFEKNILPLNIQKNNRELEKIVKECILNTIRDNIPVENILKIYLDQSVETNVEIEETKESIVDKEMLEKQEELAKTKELEKAKREAKEQIKRENELNMKKALINANKTINNSELNGSNELNIDSSKNIKMAETINDELLDDNLVNNQDTDNESDLENDKLNIDDNTDNLNLDIQTLNDDLDELNLDELVINNNNTNIDLNIQELS